MGSIEQLIRDVEKVALDTNIIIFQGYSDLCNN